MSIAEPAAKFAGYWAEHARRWREPGEVEARVAELEAWRAEHEDEHEGSDQ
ncbi:MAG TPA: hypothetical protein VM142_01680 [Acidimicrobiales bacterium]|nr:hypothetical protein [Acidimicrobiales bacterium]